MVMMVVIVLLIVSFVAWQMRTRMYKRHISENLRAYTEESESSLHYRPIAHVNPYPWGTEAWHQCNLGVDPKVLAYVTDILEDERGVTLSFVTPPWAWLDPKKEDV